MKIIDLIRSLTSMLIENEKNLDFSKFGYIKKSFPKTYSAIKNQSSPYRIIDILFRKTDIIDWNIYVAM